MQSKWIQPLQTFNLNTLKIYKIMKLISSSWQRGSNWVSWAIHYVQQLLFIVVKCFQLLIWNSFQFNTLKFRPFVLRFQSDDIKIYSINKSYEPHKELGGLDNLIGYSDPLGRCCRPTWILLTPDWGFALNTGIRILVTPWSKY